MRFRTKQRTNYIKFLLDTFMNEKFPDNLESLEPVSTDLQKQSSVKNVWLLSAFAIPKSSLNFKSQAPVENKNALLTCTESIELIYAYLLRCPF